MTNKKKDNESTTAFWVRQIQEQARHDAIEECAAVAQRWADDSKEFIGTSERSKIMHNVCQNLAAALRNLKEPPC